MKNRKPAWWPLFLLIPVMFGMMLLLHSEHLSAGWEEAGDGLAVILTFGMILAWVQMNEGALARSDLEQQGRASSLQITEYPALIERRQSKALSHGERSGGTAFRPAPIAAWGETEGEEGEDKWLVN